MTNFNDKNNIKNINNASDNDASCIKFSVCIPYYNAGDFIEECLASVVRQTYTNWEILVLNDGSTQQQTDKLVDVVGRMRQHMNGQHQQSQDGAHVQSIEIIPSHNRGLFGARCKMFEAAKGDIIINLDADDLLFADNALEEIAEAFNKYSTDMVIYNATRSTSGAPDKNLSSIVGHNTTTDIDVVRQQFCCNDQLNNVWMKAIPRDIVLKSLDDSSIDKKRFLNMTEDIYFSCFFLDNVSSVYVIDKPLYFYRVNSDSTVFKRFDDTRLDDQIFVQMHLEKYAECWAVSDFDAAKHTAEFFVYGDIMYINLSDASKAEKLDAYKKLSQNSFVKSRMANCNLSGIPLHKKIPLSLFKKNRFRMMDFYFNLLRELKNLRRK